MFDSAFRTPNLEGLRSLVSGLGRLEVASDDAERVDQIRLLEEVKAAAAAAQARVTTTFAASQRAAQVAAGVRADQLGRGVTAQVGLAKRESPTRAARYVAWAGVLVRDLPITFAALQAGQVSEWRAQLVARETGWLAPDQRGTVDAEIGPRLTEWGDRRVEAEARRAAYRLDPHGCLARVRGAESDRHVSLRPAPETMSKVSALLPVAQGVAVFAALSQYADSCRAAGDPRSRGQVMADTLVERVTGQSKADAVPIQVNLLMTDTTLLLGDDAPGELLGHTPVPAPLARRLARTAATDAQAWVRRLYTHPDSGELVGMDSRRRVFDGALADFLVARDRACRTPWCDAPIRHLDHVTAFADGGPTSAANGQGLCEACNHAKQAPGWSSRAGPAGAGREVEVTTPTGHRYPSRPPNPPGWTEPSRVGRVLRDLAIA